MMEVEAQVFSRMYTTTVEMDTIITIINIVEDTRITTEAIITTIITDAITIMSSLVPKSRGTPAKWNVSNVGN